LGYEDLDFGDPINWHLDAVNGKISPQKAFYKIPFLRFDEVGDVKVIWELNRHQHLVTLARAFCFTGDLRFAHEIVAQWYAWRKENPYPRGVNWASSLEVAFRCLSWLWVRHLLADSAMISPQFWDDLGQALLLGGRHIQRYLSFYFSPNTHLLGEAVALFFLGVLCGGGRTTDRWRSAGWEIVQSQAERQVLSDGMHFEQATYYHLYALDFFLHARILAERNGMAIPSSFDGIIIRMLKALAVTSRTGVPPRFGDDDGGRVFDPRRNRPENLMDPLCTGSVLFGDPALKPVGGRLTEETVWLLGPEAAEEFYAMGESKITDDATISLPSAASYLMRCGRSQPYELSIDAGPQGVPGGGHGHADALSIQLSARGQPLLIDAGTFVYVGPDSEREWFRGTSAHNTLRVDGEDQAVAKGPFSWRRLPQARLERWVQGDAFNLLCASHTGYQRLANPVLHQRRVFHLEGEFWFVLDVALGHGTHEFDLYWHVAPSIVWHRGDTASIARGSAGSVALASAHHTSSTQSVQEGWYSPVYGQRMKTEVLRFHRRCAVPTEFASVLIPGVEDHGDAGALVRVEDSEPQQGISIYAYRRPNTQHAFVWGSAPAGWRWRGLSSDAELLYWGGSGGRVELLIATGASYIAIDNHPLVDCPRRAERIELSSLRKVCVSGSDNQVLKGLSAEDMRLLNVLSERV